MDSPSPGREIIATYEKHGWSLRRVLLSQETKAVLRLEIKELFGDAEVRDSDFDALWFARASPGDREAWELRLMSEQPYALFELFEADESEEDREEARLEMENRMREHMGRA